MMDESAIPLKRMVDANLALLVQADLSADEREYRRGWPETVRPLEAYCHRLPNVVLVDKTFPIPAVAERAHVALGADPASFEDFSDAVEMKRYVIYVHDGFGRFSRKPLEAVEALPADELPLTLTEGIFLLLHHPERRLIRHGIICAGSCDERGRYPVISAVSRGYLLSALEPTARLYRDTVASRGLIIPSSM